MAKTTSERNKRSAELYPKSQNTGGERIDFFYSKHKVLYTKIKTNEQRAHAPLRYKNKPQYKQMGNG